jgi:Tol biopolymer transport system component
VAHRTRAALTACGQRQTSGHDPAGREISIIPRAALLGNPERTQARLAPNGDYLSFLAPVNGYLNIYVTPLSPAAAPDIKQARPITGDATRGIKYHLWAPDGKSILFMQDVTGNDTWRLFSVDVVSKKSAISPRSMACNLISLVFRTQTPRAS